MASLMSRKPCLVLFLQGSPTLSAYWTRLTAQFLSHSSSPVEMGTEADLLGECHSLLQRDPPDHDVWSSL